MIASLVALPTNASESYCCNKKDLGIINLNSVVKGYPIEKERQDTFSNSLSRIIAANYPDKLNGKELIISIKADSQSQTNGKTIICKGNVEITFQEGTLKADKVIINLETHEIHAKGNVVFIRGSQYLRANSFKYNLKTNYGEINQVDGKIDLETFNQDFSILTEKDLSANYNLKEKDLLYLKDGFELVLGNLESKVNDITNYKISTKEISNWRIKSPSIIIQSGKWLSKEMILTNDPLNPAKITIFAEDVTTQEMNGKTIIISKNNYVKLKRRLKVPIGKKILGKESNFTIKYDSEDRDGLYLARDLPPYKRRQYTLYLKPEILIQRALTGETSSYVTKDSNILSEPVKDTSYFSDLLGLKFALEGKHQSWDLNLKGDISSLNIDRIQRASRLSLEMIHSFDTKLISDIDVGIYSTFRDKTRNGSLEKTDVYTAYGVFLEKSKDWGNNKIRHNLRTRLGVGDYQAESRDSATLYSDKKTSLINILTTEYKIYEKSKDDIKEEFSFNYLPVRTNENIKLRSEVMYKLIDYSNDNHQNILGYKIGPIITLGNYRKKYFDYTKLSIMPQIKFKSGESPFKFDNEVDLKTISISLTQQLYSDYALHVSTDLNIDKGSEYYGKYTNNEIALLNQNRAYDLGVYYRPSDKTGGIIFRMYGFNIPSPSEHFHDE